MSILRPKDGDYIVRGLFLLITWAFLGWVPFAVVGGILAGAGGAAVGFFGAIVIVGPFLYTRYLWLDPGVVKYRKVKASRWWRINAQDPHDWSV